MSIYVRLRLHEIAQTGIAVVILRYRFGKAEAEIHLSVRLTAYDPYVAGQHVVYLLFVAGVVIYPYRLRLKRRLARRKFKREAPAAYRAFRALTAEVPEDLPALTR